MLMSSTPEFWTMIARIWTFAPKVPALRREILLSDLSGFIADSNPGNPDHLSQLIDGAGGTVDDLAKLVVEFIRDVAGRSKPLIAASPATDISRLVDFVKEADSYPGTPGAWLSSPLTPLSTEMLFQEAINALIAAMFSLIRMPVPETAEALKQCFTLLERLLLSVPGYTWLEEALDRGLLQVIVESATLACASQLHRHLHFFLAQLIPQGLVFFHNVLQLGSAIDGVLPLVVTDDFRACEVCTSSDWENFMTVASERMEIFDGLDDTVASKACDNLKCTTIDAKAQFKRCGGCSTFYYCSKECQKVDWQHGGHRSACRTYGDLSLNASNSNDSIMPSGRECDFFRALLQKDYGLDMRPIYRAQLKFMMANPMCTLFFTLFDYCTTPVKIEVLTTERSPLTANLHSKEWDDMISRAGRSEGRMHLHVFKVAVGPIKRCLVAPLRTSSSRAHDSLRALAGTLDAEATDAQISTAIETVIRDTTEVVAIY
ncbi:hypothetical protein DFH06DRAFT_1169030 [Mycena polygramma]|nr:hypothetical protein DFH06DRAFT_1169030 [Mycena polygramma]